MASTASTLPQLDDVVTLQVGNEEIVFKKGYSIHSGIFTQPCAFEYEMFVAGPVKDLLRDFQPNDRFGLYINGDLQFEGHLDKVNSRGDANSSSVTFGGRDDLAPLHDSHVLADKSFDNLTPTQLVQKALDEVGIRGATITTDYAASKKTRSGVAVVSQKKADRPKPPGKAKKRAAHIGESWYSCIQRELKHAGEFLFAAPGKNNFVISRPDATQAPVARLFRLESGEGNIKSWEWDNDTTNRAASYQVVGKTGGKRTGPGIVGGIITDKEMTAYGFLKRHVMQDNDTAANEEGDFFAARKLAEARRAGRRLVYTVAGHSERALRGGGRVIWTPDTILDVYDQWLGITESMYLENVAFRETMQGTVGELRLMRLGDLPSVEASP